MSFGFDDYGRRGDEYGGNENNEDGGASPGIESDNDEEYGEEVDLGPPIMVIPETASPTRIVLDPRQPLGLSLTPEGWVEAVHSGSQAEAAGMRRGTRAVKLETKRGWALLGNRTEFKEALLESRGRDDESCTVTFNPALTGESKWTGGVTLKDGRIIGIPANSRQVLCVDPVTSPAAPTATTFGLLPACDNLLGDVDDRWSGGVLTLGGKVIGVPFNASQFLEIDPDARHCVPRGETILMGNHKWRGGCLCTYGRVYCFPANADSVLRIDPKTGLTLDS